MISAEQIRAARALLGWSQSELANRTGLSTPAIGNIEIEKHSPSADTQKKIINAFDVAGIAFIEDGVKKKQDKIRFIESENAILELLDDIFYSARKNPDMDVLVFCADESVTPPEGIDKIRQIRKTGAKFRHIIKEGDHYMMGPLNEYKWMPEEYFINHFQICYDNKSAFVIDNASQPGAFQVTIIKDPNLYICQKNFFEFFWSVLKQPTWSSATEKY